MPISLHYLFKRIVFSLAVIIGVITVAYLITYIAPVDPAYVWAGRPRGPGASEAIEKAREYLGLDKPVYIQVINYISRFLHGDLGVSLKYKVPVVEIIWRGLTATLELLFIAYLIGVPIGVYIGVKAALHRGSWFDGFTQIFSITMANMPAFWLGVAFIAVLSSIGFGGYGRVDEYLEITTGFHPITGFYLLDSLLQLNIPVFIDVLLRLLPPAIVVATYPLGLAARLARAMVSEAFHEEYVRSAISLGLPRRMVVWRYAFRGIVPAFTQVMGLAFAYSLVDALVVEIVFGREGIGKIVYDAIPANDYPLVIGVVITVAVFYVVANTIADIVQATIDPRVRL